MLIIYKECFLLAKNCFFLPCPSGSYWGIEQRIYLINSINAVITNCSTLSKVLGAEGCK